ncbi:MAG: capsular biosynthesis protein [Brevundimonas sp.]
MSKRLIVDLDDTICFAGEPSDPGRKYQDHYASAAPNLPLIERLREYRESGFEIVIHTARSMRTYGGDVDKIRQFSLPVITAWLDRYSVPYDEIVVGKPWCGFEGFYIDDRSIRPSEFISKSLGDINELLGICRK